MAASSKWFAQIEPDVRERECGGWLAVSEAGAPLRIAVAAPSAEEARHRFQSELAAWGRIFEEVR